MNQPSRRRIKGFKRRTWIRLSGLLSKGLPAKIVSQKDCHVFEDGNLVEVTIKNSNVDYNMRCYLPEGLIWVTYCEIEHSRQGIATALLKHKINVARSMKFQKIECTASAEFNTRKNKKFDGYIVWGKLGFTMRLSHEVKKFVSDRFIINKMHVKMLHELLKDKKGTAEWVRRGWTWKAHFLLGKGSVNNIIFKEYRRMKYINRQFGV